MITPKSLYDGLGTAALADTYTVPANTKAIIKAATLCNDTGGAVLCTVKIVTATAGTLRTMVDERSLADKETYPCPELINLVLMPGGMVQILGLNVAFVLSGVEVT